MKGETIVDAMRSNNGSERRIQSSSMFLNLSMRTPAIAALIFANLRGTVGEAQRSHPWSNVCDA